MAPVEKTGWMKRAYGVRTKDDVEQIYRGWAPSYDDELTGQYGYVAPKIVIDSFTRGFKDTDALILDAGCGTGLAGEELARRGYTKLHGVDYSQEMLDQAAPKGLYGWLAQADMMGVLDIADDAYDAAVSVGVFSIGHVHPSALDEMLRIIRPGGVFCLSINELVFEENGYRAAFDALESADRAAVEELHRCDYMRETGVKGWVARLKVH